MNKKINIINVGNGNNKYPGNFTKKEKNIIKKHRTGKTLNLFSGKSKIGETRVDFLFGNVKKDVFKFLNNNNKHYNTIIIDAPYNNRFAKKYKKYGTPEQFIIFANAKKTTKLFNKIVNINPKLIILKSWNYYIPTGYDLKKGFLCYAGGYRKPTLLLIMEREERK